MFYVLSLIYLSSQPKAEKEDLQFLFYALRAEFSFSVNDLITG
jgi:hypothetical protein